MNAGVSKSNAGEDAGEVHAGPRLHVPRISHGSRESWETSEGPEVNTPRDQEL